MSSSTAEEFLDKKVKKVFEPIISQILIDKPKNQVIQ